MKTSVYRWRSSDFLRFARLFAVLATYLRLATFCRAQTFNVSGKDKWTDTGIRVRSGIVIQVNATGKVDFGPSDGVFGPDGVETFNDRSDYLLNASAV